MVALAACSGFLPNSAVSRHLAARYAGALEASTPVATVVRDRHLRPPDLAADVPLLDQLADALATSDVKHAFAGVTYDLTKGNRLAGDWIVQSPNWWGRKAADLPYFPLKCTECESDVSLPACSIDADCHGGTCTTIWPASGSPADARRNVCFGHSDSLVARIHDLVASARERVDITLLQPPTEARFLGGLRAALFSLALGRKPVTVRILIGHYPTGEVDPKVFLSTLTAGLDELPQARLSISVAAMRSCVAFDDCDSYSWNHSKIITVDGKEALSGGHNWWSADYLVDRPVHDLSMRFSGPAATSAARFADALWEFVCVNRDKAPKVAVATWMAGQAKPGNDCLVPAELPASRPAKGGVPILTVGRLGAGITKDFANQSELARELMMGAAQKSIRIVQQDLGFNLGRADTLYPDSDIDRLVDFLLRREGDIYIVLSNQAAMGNSGSFYSNDVSLAQLALHIRDALQERLYRRDPQSRYAVRTGPDPANAMLCNRLHLAPLRFGPDDKWPGNHPIAVHAKFWMIDDRAFYVGSDNMYPVNLQEFGYIVDDTGAARELLDAWWGPMWQWSQRAAVSGPEVKDCIFRKVPNH
jgi:hypothetical protein